MSDYYWEYKIVNTKNTHTNKTAWERERERERVKRPKMPRMTKRVNFECENIHSTIDIRNFNYSIKLPILAALIVIYSLICFRERKKTVWYSHKQYSHTLHYFSFCLSPPLISLTFFSLLIIVNQWYSNKQTCMYEDWRLKSFYIYVSPPLWFGTEF